MSTTDVLKPEVLTDSVAPPAPVGWIEEYDGLCPYCGAHYQAGPEGAVDPVKGTGWASHFHCWRCGFNPTAQQGVVQGTLPAFGPGLSAQFAQQLAAQVHAALGLPEGTNLGDLIAQVKAAQDKQPAQVTSQAQGGSTP